MTILRDELHHLVDLLPDEQIPSVLEFVRDHGGIDTPPHTEEDWPLPEFVGMFASGEGDLSEKSADFIRESLGGAADQ
jgi:hypothetical protein